jgi:hypothetical protein
MRDEQFGFRPRRSTSLQLARLVERVTRNFGEKRLTGAVFLNVAKAFDTVWIDGLLYKLTRLNFLLNSRLHGQAKSLLRKFGRVPHILVGVLYHFSDSSIPVTICRHSLPRRGQSLLFLVDRWPSLQINALKIPVLHSPYNLIIPPRSDVRRVLPNGHAISSCGLGWLRLSLSPSPLQSVCERHPLTLAPRRVGALPGRHGHHSHVPQSETVRQLPGVLPQRPSTVVEGMENRHKYL